MISSYILARMKLSVQVNSLYLPFDKATDVIRRFCTPATFHNDHEVFDLSAVGSTLRLRYRGRNLVLFTKHQLGRGASSRSAETFALPLAEHDGSRVGAGPIGVTTVKMQHEVHENLEDLVLVEYEDTRGARDFRPLFLNLDLDATLSGVPPEQVKAIFAVGYPSAFDEAEFAFDEAGMPTGYGTISRCVKLYLARSEPGPLDTENRLPMVQDDRADQQIIEPDGMSGAPVFFVWLDQETNAHLGLAGFITDARPNRYMVYDAAMLKRILDEYVERP